MASGGKESYTNWRFYLFFAAFLVILIACIPCFNIKDYESCMNFENILVNIGKPILFIYALCTLWIVLKNAITQVKKRDTKGNHIKMFRIQPVLGICYAYFLFQFIFQVYSKLFANTRLMSITAISGFSRPGVDVFRFIVVHGMLAATAFCTNFCRAAYTLNSLEYRVFDNVPGFGDNHLKSRSRATKELLYRIGAAISFIYLERSLSTYMGFDNTGYKIHQINIMMIINIGTAAFLLYIFLSIWYYINRSYFKSLDKKDSMCRRYVIF